MVGDLNPAKPFYPATPVSVPYQAALALFLLQVLLRPGSYSTDTFAFLCSWKLVEQVSPDLRVNSLDIHDKPWQWARAHILNIITFLGNDEGFIAKYLL